MTYDTDTCSACDAPSPFLLRCGGTCGGRAKYCDRNCQRKHWKQKHRSECQKINENHVEDVLAALSLSPEIIDVTGEGNKVRVTHSDSDETFAFSTEAECKRYVVEYAALRLKINDYPTNNLAANAQLQTIQEFTAKWGEDYLPKRAADHQRSLAEFAYLGRYVPGFGM